MRQYRKIEYLTIQVNSLKSKVSDLEKENSVLSRENESLKKVNDEKQDIIDRLVSKLNKVRDDYLSSLEEIMFIKDKYKTLVLSTKALEKKYKKEMERLLSRLKKQA